MRACAKELAQAEVYHQHPPGAGRREIARQRDAPDNALASFEPARDGRLGGYLVCKGLIAAEQLNKALLQQQKAWLVAVQRAEVQA